MGYFDCVINETFPRNTEKYDVITKIRDVIKKHLNKLTTTDIDNLIFFMYKRGYKTGNRFTDFNGPMTEIRLTYLSSYDLLNMIAIKNDFSEKSLVIIFNTMEHENMNIYMVSTSAKPDITKWISFLESRGYIIPNEYEPILKKWNSTLSMGEIFKEKKVNLSNILKYLKTKGNIFRTLINQNTFIDIIKKNKIIPGSKLFYFFLNESRDCEDCNVVDIMTLFKQLEYVPTINECVCAMCHHSCAMAHTYESEISMKSSQKDKFRNNLSKLLLFFETNNVDISQILNLGMLSMPYGFGSYLVDTKQINHVDKNIGVMGGILQCNYKVLNYYVEKKFIATEQHILLLLNSIHKSYNKTTYVSTKFALTMLEYFVKNGTEITKNIVYPLICASVYFPDRYGENNGDIGTIAKYCNTLTDSEYETIKENISNIVTKVNNCPSKKIKVKKISLKAREPEKTLLHICQENDIQGFLSFSLISDVKMTNQCYTALLSNDFLNLLEFIVIRDKFKPSIFQIMTVPNFFTRYILLHRFYPEMASIENQNGTFIQSSEQPNTQLNISNDTMLKNSTNNVRENSDKVKTTKKKTVVKVKKEDLCLDELEEL